MFYGIRVAKKLFTSFFHHISVLVAEPPLPCFPTDKVVITPKSWHGRVLLSTTSPLEPPFSLILPAKCLIVRDCHNKRLRVFLVFVRLFFIIIAVVLTFSLFSVKMAVFCISEKYSFDNRNFEKFKLPEGSTLLRSIFSSTRPLIVFFLCISPEGCAVPIRQNGTYSPDSPHHCPY